MSPFRIHWNISHVLLRVYDGLYCWVLWLVKDSTFFFFNCWTIIYTLLVVPPFLTRNTCRALTWSHFNPLMVIVWPEKECDCQQSYFSHLRNGQRLAPPPLYIGGLTVFLLKKNVTHSIDFFCQHAIRCWKKIVFIAAKLWVLFLPYSNFICM